MTSQINPGLIDGNFPVQGVDNPSQGFRSNFTNTATNFQYAANEITDLQNKAILTAPLNGQTLNNNLNGSPLTNAVISGFSEAAVNLGTQQNLVSIQYGAGHYQFLSTTGTGTGINLAFIGWPPAGKYGWITLAINVLSVNDYVTLPTNVVGANGMLGSYPESTGTILSFATTGTYIYNLGSEDGGATVYVSSLYPLQQPYNASYENLGSGGNVSLRTTTTYFEGSGTNSTLGEGVQGQIKQFAVRTFTGAVTITVTTASWQNGAQGTLSLDAVGAAATLQYIVDRWYAISLINASTYA